MLSRRDRVLLAVSLVLLTANFYVFGQTLSLPVWPLP